MDIKMIVCDLDKTLLRRDGTVSAYSRGVIEKCREQGILFGIATARTTIACKDLTDLLAPHVLVTDGGALGRCGGHEAYKAMMGPEQAKEIMAILHKHKGRGVGIITASCENGYFIDTDLAKGHAWWDVLRPEYCDLSNGFTCGAYKIVPQIFDEAVVEEIAGFTRVGITRFFGEEWTNFSDTMAGKWNAVAACANYLGIAPEQIAAFGDDFSDLEMLANCGAGVAVANAIPEVKAVAKYICGTNEEDGVAVWLEEFLCK